MNAFELYKQQYVEAKIAYASSRELFFSGTEIAASEGRHTETDPECEQLRNASWQTHSKLMTAADYLVGCLAQGAMALAQGVKHDCLIGISHDIFTTYPCYRFKIEMMVVPKGDTWMHKNSDLSELANRVNYGVIEWEQAKAWLQQAGVACGEVVDCGWKSDNDILSASYDELIHELKEQATHCIGAYASKA